MKRFWSVLLVVAMLATAPVALGAHGSFERGYVAPGSPVTWRDFNRGAQLASRMVQGVLGMLFRSGASTPQAVCDDTGFTASAGTGFNIAVAAGTCFFVDATVTDPYSSSYAVVTLDTAEAATAWSANPVSAGTVVYYVHVTPGYTITDGVEEQDPRYLVNTAASVAGYLTVASVSIDHTDANAAAYTYTDLRTIANGLHYAPEAVAFGSDLSVAGNLGVVGYAEGGPTAGRTWRIAADGSARFGIAGAPKATVSTAGAVHAEGVVTVGPVAAPLAQIGVDGAMRLGTAAASVFDVDAAGNVDADGDVTAATITMTGFSVDATGDLVCVDVSPTGNLDVDGTTNLVGDLTVGPTGGPAVATLTALTGDFSVTGPDARIVVSGREVVATAADYAFAVGGDIAHASNGGLYPAVVSVTTSVARTGVANAGGLLILYAGNAADDPGALQNGNTISMNGGGGGATQRAIYVEATADSPEYSLYAEAGEIFAGEGLDLTGDLVLNGTTVTGDLALATLALVHAADPTGGGADGILYVAYVDGAWMGSLQSINSTTADALFAASGGGQLIVEHAAAPAGFPIAVDEAGTAYERLVFNNTALGTDIHVALSNGRIITIHHDAGAGAMPKAYFDSNGGTVAQRIVFLSATATSRTHGLNPRRELTPLRP